MSLRWGNGGAAVSHGRRRAQVGVGHEHGVTRIRGLCPNTRLVHRAPLEHTLSAPTSPTSASAHPVDDFGAQHREPHSGGAGRLNWLRAGVLGANDGIVSVAGIVVGVAGATSARGAIFTAGLAGLAAGAVSMALGEYVSVSSQRDSEKAMVSQETDELTASPEAELEELAAMYRAKGLTPATARTVAVELTARDPLGAHLEAEFGIDQDDLANPFQASLASAVSFTLGALLPMVAILLPPQALRVPVTVASVLLALAMAGAASARVGGSRARPAVTRVVLGGSAGLALTYGIGHLFGSVVS